jgi:hypothetical protein
MNSFYITTVLTPIIALLADAGQPPDENTGAIVDENKFRQIFRIKAVHLLAVFAIVYIGIEVTIGGWIVTYIIEERGGGHSAGYISSGFFGGLMLGRLGLMWLNKIVRNLLPPKRMLNTDQRCAARRTTCCISVSHYHRCVRIRQDRTQCSFTLIDYRLELTIWFVPSVIGNAVAVGPAPIHSLGF